MKPGCVTSNPNWNLGARFRREKIHWSSKYSNAKLRKWNKWWQWLTIIQIPTYAVLYGCTVNQHVYMHFPKFWSLKFHKCVFNCSIVWSSPCQCSSAYCNVNYGSFSGIQLERAQQYTVQSWSESPRLRPIPKTQGTTLGDSFQRLKWAVFGHDQRDSAAQQKPAPTQNRKATGMLASAHFMRGGLHWSVIM